MTIWSTGGGNLKLGFLCHGRLPSYSPGPGKALPEVQQSEEEGSSVPTRNGNQSHKVFMNQEVKACWCKQEKDAKKGRQCQLYKLES